MVLRRPLSRSEVMARVRAKDTKPEIRVRSLAHSLGYRFRLHRRDLPGCPDLVFVRLRKIIFVHGCFWHQHRNCRGARQPKSNTSYWRPKLDGNRSRDMASVHNLRRIGWQVLVVWECQTRNPHELEHRVAAFLNSTKSLAMSRRSSQRRLKKS